MNTVQSVLWGMKWAITLAASKRTRRFQKLYSCGHQNFLLHDTVALWAEASVCSGNERLGR